MVKIFPRLMSGDSVKGALFARKNRHRPTQNYLVSPMSKKLDQILVIDLEATCWDGPIPTGQRSEIIEIGICPLELHTGRRLEKRSIIVKPTQSTISPFCTQLTTLTQAMVDQGTPFTMACEILRKEYLSRDRVWASFGDYDRTMFQEQCKHTGVPYPFGPRHLNVKTLFALARGLPSEVGMAAALELENLPLVGTHHRGDDDAWNIAEILNQLMKRLRN